MDKNLIPKYRSKGVLVDTNLLVCLIAGLYSPDFMQDFKRTSNMKKEDFEIIKKFLNQFKKIVVTPHILTEVNSFLNQIGEPNKVEVIKTFLAQLEVLDEEFELANKIGRSVGLQTFVNVGLTDSAIIHHAKGKYLVFTDDGRLTNFLTLHKIDYINYNHLKQYQPE